MTSLLQLAFPSPFFVDFICQPFYDQLIRRRRDGRRLGSICERYVGLTEKECKEDFALDLYFWSNEKKGSSHIRTYKECINGWKFLTSKNRSFDKFLTNKSLECVGNNQLVNEGYLPGIPKPCWLPQLLEKFFCFRKKVVKSKAFIHFSSTSSISITKKSKRLH